jgi:inosose dehydratase
VFQVGCAPITWNNEDLADLGPPVAYTRVLDEVRAAGYTGTELGAGFPQATAELRHALDERGLELPSAWCGLALGGEAADLEHTRRVCGVLGELGARFVNLAHQGTPERRAWAGRASQHGWPGLSASEWDAVADAVSQAAEIARAAGLQAAFHPHVGTWVETSAEVDELLQRTDPDLVKLCWDVGHALYAGSDPVARIRANPERIAYIHLKDVNPSVRDGLLSDQAGFEDGIRRRVFTELGRGCVDVAGVLDALRAIAYTGWLMVEQDSSWLPADESARQSRAFLRTLGV